MKHFPREYTGLERTPSSMVWLLKQRASIRGRIEHKTKQRAKLQAEINGLRQKLSAVDRIMRQHEVQVEPEEVHAKRPHRPRIAGSGQMTRLILEQLREANGKPLTTTELAIGFANAIGIDRTMGALREARVRLRRRLTGLVSEGIVRNINDQRGEDGVYREGEWLLTDTDD